MLHPPSGFWVTVSRKGLHWEGPSWATHWGAFDWGYTHPFAFASFRRVGNVVTWLDTAYGHKLQDEEMAALIRGTVDPRCLAEVYAGHDAFAKGMAHSAAAETVADVFDRYGIALARANIDRAAGAKALRRLFARVSSAKVTLVVNDTPGNRRAVHEFAKLIPDHLNLDIPAKRDANESGENGDDGADAARYGLVNVGSETFEPLTRTEPGNVASGRDPDAVLWAPDAERSRTRGGVVVQYEERPTGADGQFGF